jgi:hypothetical protein
MQIAKDTGTVLHAWDEEQNVIDSQGEPLDPDEAGEYGRLLWDYGLIAAAFKYSNENTKSIPAERSLYDFFEEKVKDLFTDIPAVEAERKRKTLLQTISMWGAYVGSPVERQSLKFFFLEECIEGENPFVAGTYEKILEAVAKPAREMATIRLETKVIRVISDESRTRPELEIADGTRLAFDEVVCTMPLGMCFRIRSLHSDPFMSSRSHMDPSVLRLISTEDAKISIHVYTDSSLQAGSKGTRTPSNHP